MAEQKRSRAATVPKGTPLTVLLSWAWIAFTIEADNTAEAEGSDLVGRLFRVSMAMWANGLRWIDEDGITVEQLRSAAGAACNIGGMERWGWIRVGEPVSGRRDGYGTQRGIKPDTVLRPRQGGSYARHLWPQVVGETEQAWVRRFGGDLIAELRAALVPAGNNTGALLPWAPPEVHPSDGFLTHTFERHDVEEGELPLPVLLAQALVARTLAAEQICPTSLPMAANFLRVVGSEQVAQRELPARSGVSKEAVAMAVGWLKRRRLGTGTGPTISLTPAGLDALDGYEAAMSAKPKDSRLRNALVAVLSQTDGLSEGLIPPEGCWRAEKPYRAQTDRLLVDPLGSLPRHPMVLHRGGWPDGS